jgi:anti-anti-sigma factor
VADPSGVGTGLAISVYHDTTLPALVVEVTGELDTLTAPRLQDALRAALREPCPVVIVDLTGVEFMGPAGLAVLVEAHDHAGSSTSLRIVAPARATLRPLQITGLDAVLNVYESRPDALTPSR